MNRRVLISCLGVATAAALAGCLGGPNPPTAGSENGNENGSESQSGNGGGADDGGDGGTGGSAGGTGDGAATGTHPRFTETSLTATGRCENPGAATVQFDDEAVTVTGCAHGRNGCSVPVLDDVAYAVKGDLLTVVVATEVDRGDDEMCTQALVPLGYRVRVTMDGMVPGTARVVHDDVDGRREVARTRRGGA
jgi:hypothetical protein